MGADCTRPNRTRYSIPCDVTLRSGGGRGAGSGGGNSLTAGGGAWHQSCSGERLSGSCGSLSCFLLTCIVVVPVFPLFAVLLNCPYPDPPVSASFFPFSSARRRGEGPPRGAFVAGGSRNQNTHIFPSFPFAVERPEEAFLLALQVTHQILLEMRSLKSQTVPPYFYWVTCPFSTSCMLTALVWFQSGALNPSVQVSYCFCLICCKSRWNFFELKGGDLWKIFIISTGPFFSPGPYSLKPPLQSPHILPSVEFLAAFCRSCCTSCCICWLPLLPVLRPTYLWKPTVWSLRYIF